MRRPTPPLPSHRDTHATARALGSLAASLLVVTLTIHLWPAALAPETAPPPPPRAAEAIVLETIAPTRQPPPPANLPRPTPPVRSPDLPPLEVPDEVVVAQIRDDLPPPPRVERLPPSPTPGPPSPPAPSGPPGPPAPPGPPGPAPPSPSTTRIVEAPERSPRPSQLSFPVYPDALRRDGIRARVVVRVLVTETGQALEPRIVERYRIERGDREVAVASLPPSMEASALEAARRARFRAARDGGERVRAYADLPLAFDPSRR